MSENSLHIWIVGEDCQGRSLTLKRRWVKPLIVSFFLTPLFVGLLGVELGKRFLSPLSGNGSSAINQAALPEIGTDINLAGAEKALAEKLPATNSAEEKLRLLTEQFVSLRKYENQLKKRAASLDAIIADIGKLEFDFARDGETSTAAVSPSELRTKQKLRGSTARGIGGGDEPRSPIIRVRPQPPKASTKTSAGNDSKGNLSRKSGSPEKVSMLINELDERIRRLNSIPLGAPVQGRYSSGFGPRYTSYARRAQMHSGMDFSAEPLSPVLATADGLVLNAGPKGAYGHCVIIKHRNGIETLYGHLAKTSVKPGDKVCRGQQIGYLGSTGRSTGPHVHYEVRIDGAPHNPVPFVELASYFRMLQL